MPVSYFYSYLTIQQQFENSQVQGKGEFHFAFRIKRAARILTDDQTESQSSPKETIQPNTMCAIVERLPILI